jgi:outer membrane protein assembly factor BamE
MKVPAASGMMQKCKTLGKQHQSMRVLRYLASALALLATVGCIHPYKTEIQQGNVVTQEMIEKLKPGMTKSQVRFVLGTPLITDPFHPERWDYVYVFKKNVTAPAETKQFTVIFNGDSMARVEGDMAPTPAATVRDGAADTSASRERTESSTPPRAL